MLKKTLAKPVEWLSEKAEWQQINDPNFTYKIVDFYKKFKFKNIIAEVGEFVLVSNADSADPDTVEGCDVAQITKLYESHDKDLSDRFRAHVQWFSKASDLPAACLKDIDFDLDQDVEVVEDHRPFDKDVSIETFFKKCNIVKMPTTAAVAEIVKNQTNNKTKAYICRFRLVALTRKKFSLEPILDEERATYSSRLPVMKTPSRKIKENLALSKTPNSLIKKFASSSISERSEAWAVKNSDNSKLVLMRDITNNYDHPSPSAQQNKRKSTICKGASPRKIINQKIISKLTDADVTALLLSDDDDESAASDGNGSIDSIRRSLNFGGKSTPTKKNNVSERNIENTPTRRTSRIVKQSFKYSDDFVESEEMPKTKSKETLCTPTKKLTKAPVHTTPSRSKTVSEYAGDRSDSDNSLAPKTPKRLKATPRTPIVKAAKKKELTPSIRARENPVLLRDGGLQLARESLHVCAVPRSLPCREEEFNNIFTFIEGKISDNSGGCMYISGVPGTGKTATVTEVVRCLNKRVKSDDLPHFEFIEINGMRLTEPRQAYVHIYRQLTGKTVAWEQACSLLEARFTKPAPRRNTIVLLIDELDVLCNRRQDVLYNLLDWPSKAAAHLVVVAIANTMDLPERLLMGRVASRLGLTRLTFQPYTYSQLQSIVTARLADTGAFHSDAVQLVSRKVAAVSGDARRALDICRRAVELAEENEGKGGCAGQVGLSQVNRALSEMIASPKVQAIKSCSKMEQLFLQATSAEVQRTGIEETTFAMVFRQLEAVCAFGGLRCPSLSECLGVCARLGSCRLLISEHSRQDIHQKLLLNVSTDDVHYATQTVSVF